MTSKPDDAVRRWSVGVDVGGTFTDLILAGGAGEVHVVKVPSVPADPAQGVINALERAAADVGSSLAGLLGGCALFVHGATIATNTVLEGKGARVGLLATDGFRDSLEIRRGARDNPWDHRTPYPPVLVPRYLRRPIRGRLDRAGRELEPLAIDDVEAAAGVLAEEGVEAVAISLFNSFVNDQHERLAADALARAWPGAWIFTSAATLPVMGEYERTSTTVVNAYVAPGTVGYLQALDQRLRASGLARPMLLVQNNGGAIPVDQLARRPVTLLLSGPAAGVGALRFYRQALGSDDLISMEIGGTSCDVILMSRGEVAVTDSLRVGGYDLAVPSIDIHTVGAGGGTIAGVDAGGMLYVGPAGAGAAPGPAAYDQGGAEPTVTDAQLVLGRLRPGPYANGSISLSEECAREAIATRIASRLGIGIEDAAAGIIRLVEQNLLQAVQQISSEHGHDPRRFTLVAGGGAGPMHGAIIGRLLGCGTVYVPRYSGVFCALGMLNSDVRHDFIQVFLTRLDDLPVERMDEIFEELETRGRRRLAEGGFPADRMVLTREFDLRYLGQQFDLRVGLGSDGFDPQRVLTAFEAEHGRRFGHVQPGGVVEITKLRLTALGRLPSFSLPGLPGAEDPPRPRAARRVFLDPAAGWRETDIYAADDLLPGHWLDGPALIEATTTTVLLGPDDRLEVDHAGNFRIALPPSGGFGCARGVRPSLACSA